MRKPARSKPRARSGEPGPAAPAAWAEPAESVARTLRTSLERRARVLPAAEVVRGDLLLLEAGDIVAADARLLTADSLRASEAPLTGESETVGKAPAPLPSDTPLADRRNMVYLGTSIAVGQG